MQFADPNKIIGVSQVGGTHANVCKLLKSSPIIFRPKTTLSIYDSPNLKTATGKAAKYQ